MSQSPPQMRVWWKTKARNSLAWEAPMAANDAVIYCRVSTKKQEQMGDGLCSQETMCRHYATWKGYNVTHVFGDSRSGRIAERPAMRDLLRYLQSKKAAGTVVIIDELSRLAREIDTHRELRRAIKAAGAILECPAQPLGEATHEKLQENIIMVMNEHWSDVVSARTKERQTARVMNGYWPFHAPVGYRHEVVAGHQGKLLVRDEPNATYIASAFERYAFGDLQTQAEVMRDLEAHPDFPRQPRGRVANEQISRMLRNPVYAGFVFSKERGVPLRKGNHEGLISVETHERILERLDGKVVAPLRKNIGDDFPLRTFVECGHCGTPLTGCWVKGKYQKYPYYFCPKKGCASYGKSIARSRIEGEFGELIRALELDPRFIKVATAMFMDLWKRRSAVSDRDHEAVKAHVSDLEAEIKKLVDRIVDTDVAAVRRRLEDRVSELERGKVLALEKAAEARPEPDCDQGLRTSLNFITSLWKLWESGGAAERRTVLKLAFTERLVYVKNEGFRTPKISLPFKALEDVFSKKNGVARPKRFELLTPRFVVWCSIQLSYGREGAGA